MDEQWPGTEAEAQWPGQSEAVPEGYQSPALSDVTKSFLGSTSIGRVAKAFGEGAAEGFGDRDLGLPKETIDWLRKTGVFRPTDRPVNPFAAIQQTFNEAMILPAARDLDAALRSVGSGITGTAHAIGQLSDETGLSALTGYGKNRIVDDVTGFVTDPGVLALTPELQIAGAALRGRMLAPERTVREPLTPQTEAAAAGASERVLATDRTDAGVPAQIASEPIVASPEKAGNINLDRIQAPEDVKDVIRETAAQNSFTEARRGTMSFDEVQDLADAAGMKPETLLARGIGQAFNAEQALAARNLLVQSATKVRELAEAAAGGSDESVLAFEESLTRHTAIQEQVAGMTAEAGRALSSFRITAGATRDAKAIGEAIEGLGGRDTIMAKIEAINALDTPQQISKFAMDARKATTTDKIVEAWINGLLSSYVTHAANMMSNSLTAALSIPESALAGAVGTVRRAAGGEGGVYLGEAKARAYATIEGAKEGVLAAGRAWRDDLSSKVDTRRQAIGGTVGKVVRTPTRLLASEDALFNAVAQRQELAAGAYRQAAGEGLQGQAMATRIAGLTANPTAAMTKAAESAGRYQTFQQPLGKAGKAVVAYFNAHPVLKFIAPFIRTPIDIAKYAGERTPLGLLSKNVRANLTGKNGAVARDTQIARMALGTSVMASAFAMAANGTITGGGPTDPRAKALLYQTGWQPYSVRIGNTFYAYSRLDPLATLLGVAADAQEIAHAISSPDASDIGTLVLGSISKNLVNKTWLQGPADLIQAIEDPDRYGSNYVSRFLSSGVPAIVAQEARTEDPYLREARTLVDSLKSRIPGVSQTLMPKRDLWGNEIVREGALGPDRVSPIYQSTVKDDPIAREMLRLGNWKSPVERTIQGVDLTPEQHDEYAKISGRLTRTALQFVGAPGWESMPDFGKRQAIDDAFTASRRMAEGYMLAAHQDLLGNVLNTRVERLTGPAPNAGKVPVVSPD